MVGRSGDCSVTRNPHRQNPKEPIVAFSEWVFSHDVEVIRVDYPLDAGTLIL